MLKFPKVQTSLSGYRMQAKADRGEIQLYGVIGESFWTEGITLKQFAKDLKSLGKVSHIDLRINSDGGDVFDGRGMYSLLAEHQAKIVVHVDGLAASIASLIAMAGDEIRMADGAFMMIHNPWGGAIGDAKEMRRMADLLDSVRDTLVTTYMARTNNKREKIVAWMDDETWMPADEAKKNGFADVVAEPVKAAARVTKPEIYKNLPSAFRPNRLAAARAIASIEESRRKPGI
jgi:ATP-dependent protease ClpP protease subunit